MVFYAILGMLLVASVAMVIATIASNRKHKLWQLESDKLLKQFEQEGARLASQPIRSTKVGLGHFGAN